MSDVPFQFEIVSTSPDTGLIPQPHAALIGRCGTEPIRVGDQFEETFDGTRSGNTRLRVVYILQARPEQISSPEEASIDVLDAGRTAVLLVTGSEAALGRVDSVGVFRGTHVPVTAEEIVASLRAVAA